MEIISAYAIPGVQHLQIKFSPEFADYMLHKLCEHYQLKYKDVNSRSRTYPLFYVRQIFIYWLHSIYRNSVTLKEYGSVFMLGTKPMDHTTVMHTLQRIKNAIDTKEPVQPKLKSTATTVAEDYLLTSKYLKKCLLEYQEK